MRILAIIPARGGSKRIVRKNVREFDGQPIIAYSIRAALRAGCFEEVMVSTDDEEIADVARRHGAQVPFMRSAATSDDYATTADVLQEVIDNYRAAGREFDAICCLYATAPFVTPERLRQAAGMLTRGEAAAAFTCVAYSYPTQRCLVIDAKGRIAMKFPEYASARSQDLQPTYHDAGQFYFCEVSEFEKHHSLWVPDTRPVILPELEVQDLDTPVDWRLAEIKYRLVSMPGRFRTAHYEFIPYPELEEERHEEILRERNSPDVRANMVNRGEITLDDHWRFLKSLAGRRDKQYYLVCDLNGDMIASVNLEERPSTAAGRELERGIWTAASRRGQGHARRLLEELYSRLEAYGVGSIVTRVRKENAASLALEEALRAVKVDEDAEYCTFVKQLS